ncbi:MAG: hypothetical protein VKJ64_14630 [Leptolyngbyaceae bacterium]|nr:hypothetical protein [Leptolyngbyaceae bacterium]
MHSNSNHHSPPTLDRSPTHQSADPTADRVATSAPRSPRQATSPQDWSHSDSQAIPNLSSMELVKLANSSADELMDAVFEDVDYMLDKGVSVVAKRPAEQPTSVMAVESPDVGKIVYHHGEDNIAASPLTQAAPLSSIASGETTDDFFSPLSGEPDAASPHQWAEAVGFALPILGACATLGVAIAAGFLLHGPNASLRAEVEAAPSDATANQADQLFAQYMERALDSIATSDNTGSDSPSTADGALSDLTDDSENERRFADVPERVYVPVYQPAEPSLSALPTVPISGNLAPSPFGSGIGTPSPNPNSLAIAPVPLSPQPIPFGSTPAPEAAAPSDLSYGHVLVGLMQLGDRSVAMFDYAEGTLRVQVGEQIGTSGWSLVSVSETEAVIRRNGDVRSIYIGQSF